MSRGNLMAVGYQRFDKENHFPLILYILYAGGLSSGINAKREAYTADGCSKATGKDRSQVGRSY
jgi:hypothetical protein